MGRSRSAPVGVGVDLRARRIDTTGVELIIDSLGFGFGFGRRSTTGSKSLRVDGARSEG